MKKVCVNVSGLLCGEVSPGHDEIRPSLDGYTRLRSNWLLNCPIVLALDRTAHAVRASLLAAATMSTLRGALVSRAVIHAPMGIRSRLQRKTMARMDEDLAQIAVASLTDAVQFCLAAGRVLLRH
jgi:hypothetical protein